MLPLLTTYDRCFSSAVERQLETGWKDISTWDAPKCGGARRFGEVDRNFLAMAKNSQWKNKGKLADANRDQEVGRLAVRVRTMNAAVRVRDAKSKLGIHGPATDHKPADFLV